MVEENIKRGNNADAVHSQGHRPEKVDRFQIQSNGRSFTEPYPKGIF
jgi:hypothetical protein